MKEKPKSRASVIVATVVLVAAVLLGRQFGLLSSRSGVRVGCVERSGPHSWSVSYTLLDGKMEKRISTDGDGFSLSVKTESGTISVEFKDADGEIIFSEADIGTEAFEIPASGRVTVTIRADRHKGSFEIVSPPSGAAP